MKAVAFIHAYVPYFMAGGETTIHDLLRAMVENGWEVEVVLSKKDAKMPDFDYEVDGVKVFAFTEKRQIIRHLLGSDLLITHLENSERSALLGKKYRVPVVQFFHNDMEITKGYVQYGCDLAVFNTEWVSKEFPHYSGPRTIVHPRIDLSRFQGSPGEAITLVNLWSGRGKKGREGKGSETFYEMANRFPDQKFLGVIGGYGEQDIRDLPNVEIIPHTSDITGDVYSRTKILLMPSRYESFGRVAIEGASLGIPTIASPTPGLNEALGPDALYADPDDFDGWEAHIRTLLDGRKYRKYSRQYKERAAEVADSQPRELEAFLKLAHDVAVKGKYIRGW